MPNPTRREAVYRLALETLLSARTIGDVIDGKGVRASTRRSVELAAGRLGIDLAAVTDRPAVDRPAPAQSSPSRVQSKAAKRTGKGRGGRGKGSAARSAERWQKRVEAREAFAAPPAAAAGHQAAEQAPREAA